MKFYWQVKIRILYRTTTRNERIHHTGMSLRAWSIQSVSLVGKLKNNGHKLHVIKLLGKVVGGQNNILFLWKGNLATNSSWCNYTTCACCLQHVLQEIQFQFARNDQWTIFFQAGINCIQPLKKEAACQEVDAIQWSILLLRMRWQTATWTNNFRFLSWRSQEDNLSVVQ